MRRSRDRAPGVTGRSSTRTRSWARVARLLTFWPPGPPLELNVKSSAPRSIHTPGASSTRPLPPAGPPLNSSSACVTR